MFRTLTWSTVGLAVAAGGPFLYSSATDYLKASNSQNAVITALAGGTRSSAAETPAAAADNPAVEGTTTRDLADVFRFDITPNWVMGQWPRVSTGMSQLQLVGYRVTLVTGTAPEDIAGSLTYYFTPQQRLQRITFYGTTGDARKLVPFLMHQFHFVRHILNDPTIWLYEVPDPDDGPPKSALQIQSADVIRANEPYRRFKVSLTIERLTDA
jgi:hypothetical protein